MAGLLEDLETIEKNIRIIQIEWGKFFGGIEKKPPMDLKFRLETLLRRYSNAEIRNNTERFRYQNLAARYNVFSELWMKRLRALEEGRPVGLHGPKITAVPVHDPALGGHGAAAATLAAPSARAGGGAGSEVRVKDAAQDAEAVRGLFDRFMAARREAGETAAVKFESFQKLIGQQASRILTEKGASAVDFRLETRDGKVSLKARPVR